MHTVYIIKNTITGRRYIGCTGNLDRRIEEHNRGQTKSTISKGTWQPIYTETYSNEAEAKKRERQLKSYKGGNALTKLLSRDGSVVERVLGKD